MKAKRGSSVTGTRSGESGLRRGPGSIARSGFSLATGSGMSSPFAINQAEQLDRTEANIMMTAVMSSSASEARLKRLAEARIISAALAQEHDLVGLRMQRRELEDEEKRLRAMLDVERTRVRHSRAVAAAASATLQYPAVVMAQSADAYGSQRPLASSVAHTQAPSLAGPSRASHFESPQAISGESISLEPQLAPSPHWWHQQRPTAGV